MTSKERVHAAMEGRPVDRMPVSVLYMPLYHQDHFTEFTGKPYWEWNNWCHSSPEEYLSVLRDILDKAPFEIPQPPHAPSREARGNVRYILRDGAPGRYDRRADSFEPLPPPISGHPTDSRANETQHVFDIADVKQKVKIHRAQDAIAAGIDDYLKAAVAAWPEEFILSGGLVGTVWSCGAWVGQTNTFAFMAEKPDLLDYLCARICEQNIETIRAYAEGGGDAIYIDDATSTCDMISVAHYERFSLPYMREMVREIHSHSLKAIIVYFGGVSDRLEQIASIGADALGVEASMKGYVNDIEQIAEKIGDRVTLYANLDPIRILQDGADEDLEAEILRQVAAGRKARGLILSTSSPITPFTPLARVQRFIELCRTHGATPAK